MIYKFDDYTLDAQKYELRRSGTLVAIRLKALEVLMYLVRHRDRVVPKDELLDHIWDGRVIGPSTLDSCLMEVRQALGDSGRVQCVIRTLRGRGYRFVQIVEVQEPVPALEAEPALTLSANRLDESSVDGPVDAFPVSPDVLPMVPPPASSLTLAGEYKTVTVFVCNLADALSIENGTPESAHRRRQSGVIRRRLGSSPRARHCIRRDICTCFWSDFSIARGSRILLLCISKKPRRCIKQMRLPYYVQQTIQLAGELGVELVA